LSLDDLVNYTGGEKFIGRGKPNFRMRGSEYFIQECRLNVLSSIKFQFFFLLCLGIDLGNVVCRIDAELMKA